MYRETKRWMNERKKQRDGGRVGGGEERTLLQPRNTLPPLDKLTSFPWSQYMD